jgi:phosphatidylethanolamine-binding protein (PEBP) family uncharacterized protein
MSRTSRLVSPPCCAPHGDHRPADGPGTAATAAIRSGSAGDGAGGGGHCQPHPRDPARERRVRASRLGRTPAATLTRAHTYAFQLFAIDQAPGLPAGFTLTDVIAALKGHTIGRARLDGTYENR